MFVANDNSDIICVNETWLNSTIANGQVIDKTFTLFRQDAKKWHPMFLKTK